MHKESRAAQASSQGRRSHYCRLRHVHVCWRQTNLRHWSPRHRRTPPCCQAEHGHLGIETVRHRPSWSCTRGDRLIWLADLPALTPADLAESHQSPPPLSWPSAAAMRLRGQMPAFLKPNFMLCGVNASCNALEVHLHSSCFPTTHVLFCINHRSLYFWKAVLKGAK